MIFKVYSMVPSKGRGGGFPTVWNSVHRTWSSPRVWGSVPRVWSECTGHNYDLTLFLCLVCMYCCYNVTFCLLSKPNTIIILEVQFWFHIKVTWSVHSFNGDYQSILESTGSCGYLFHEIPGIIMLLDFCLLS